MPNAQITQTATYVASEDRRPDYPCDICGQDVQSGERVHVSQGGLSVEHTACVSGWFRGNFGREYLS